MSIYHDILSAESVKSHKIKTLRKEYIHKFFVHTQLYWKAYDKINDYAYFGVYIEPVRKEHLRQEFEGLLFEQMASYANLMSTLRVAEQDMVDMIEPLQTDIRHSVEWAKQWFDGSKKKPNTKKYKHRV